MTGALQEAFSRDVMRGKCFEVWKNELEFSNSIEIGKHSLNVEPSNISCIKDWHAAVMLLLKPTSNALGNGHAAVLGVEPVVMIPGKVVDGVACADCGTDGVLEAGAKSRRAMRA